MKPAEQAKPEPVEQAEPESVEQAEPEPTEPELVESESVYTKPAEAEAEEP